MVRRKILIIYNQNELEAAQMLKTRYEIFDLQKEIDEVSLLEYDNTYVTLDEDCTDVVMLGFSYTPQQIEDYYLSGKLNVWTIDYVTENHPLASLVVTKHGIGLLGYRGKWATLVDNIFNYVSYLR